MAASQPQHEKKRMGTGSHLLTPEEPTIDSFEETQPVRPVEPRSPPESPAFRPLSTTLNTSSHPDHELYPGSTATHDRPLFDNHSTPRATPDRDSSISIASGSPKTPVSQEGSHWTPIPASTGVIGIVQRYNADPEGWHKKCMDELMELKRLKLEARQLPPPTTRPVKRDSHTLRLLESLGKARVVKSNAIAAEAVAKRTEKIASPPKPTRASISEDSTKAQPPTTKRHSRQTSTSSNALGGLPSVTAPKPRTRQPPSKVVERKDQNWNEVADYCPPKESLDSMSKKLAVEWTNKNHQDLSQDPDRIHLHPQELVVASTLRLKCDRYMLIKRLIFQEKVKFLKENKEFNKTSAQNCCNVDVNKISKLWQSFNDVGWFDKHWFEQYLH